MATAPKTATKPAAVTAAAPATTVAVKPERVAPIITGAIMLDFALPKGRASESAYAFDSLTEVGMVLGVKNKDVRHVSTAVSNQNKKFVTSTAEGGKTYIKKFAAINVTSEIAAKLVGTELEGSTALIQRTV